MKKGLFKTCAAFVLLTLASLLALPHVLPWALSRYRPDIRFTGATKGKTLFLTIDDAPSKNTPEILRVLRKHDVTATFFVIADRVQSKTQLDEVVASGHSLGNHLKTTKACSKLSLAEFRSDFDTRSAVVEQRGKARLFRPASDFGTKEQIAYAQSKGYRATLGTVFQLDHWICDPRWLVGITRWLTVRGGIVILHDGDVRGHTTAAVLDQPIPTLKAAGYVFDRLDRVAVASP
jgi:peptidoglycan-N-acetylglucosamine deacetylase